jgi:hypothetical protein
MRRLYGPERWREDEVFGWMARGAGVIWYPM